MLGNETINIDTETIAYPLDSPYYPKLMVFEAPYSVGDCPVDTIVLNSPTDLQMWVAVVEGETTARAKIDVTSVGIRDYADNPYTEGKSYELRIYPSDIPVSEVN